MRVSCQQCSAKYTVSEEKLRHGVVRLKCKQCKCLIVVQPDGTVSGGGALVGGAAAGTPSEPTNTRPSAPDGEADGAGSDNAATIPLPSLQELGLMPKELSTGRASSPSAVPGSSGLPSASGVPGPAATGRSLAPLPPPTARDSASEASFGDAAQRLSAPPSANRVKAADLDDDVAAPAAGSAGPVSASPGSTSTFGVNVHLAERVEAQVQSLAASVRRIPLLPRGWAILGGILLGGLIVGAWFAADGNGETKTPFDEASAREALRSAVAEARRCFARPVPALVGVVDAEFGPDGEPLHVEVSGGLAHVDEHRCIEDAFNAMRVKPFTGAPVQTKKTISLSFDR